MGFVGCTRKPISSLFDNIAIADATLAKDAVKGNQLRSLGNLLTMFGSLAKHVVVNVVGVLVLATAYLTSAFSAGTVPIWAPMADHASYVFLRPKVASSIVSKGIAGSIAEAVVRVSASQDEVVGDGKQRLFAAYRLFVNGIEISMFV